VVVVISDDMYGRVVVILDDIYGRFVSLLELKTKCTQATEAKERDVLSEHGKQK
jgi:hypothetical protein